MTSYDLAVGYRPTPLNKRFDKKQSERLEKIRGQLSEIRQSVDALIKNVRRESDGSQ